MNESTGQRVKVGDIMSAENIITLVIALIGAATGIVGTVLGILSYLREIAHDRLVLRVWTSWGMPSHNPDSPFLAIHVTNLSKFPVTIAEAGVRAMNGRMKVIDADWFQGQIPVKLESRMNVTIRCSPGFLLWEELDDTSTAYVLTSCGESVSPKVNEIPSMIEVARKRAGEVTT